MIPLEILSEVAQLCPTLCYPMDCSLPGFSVRGIFQAIVLEWIALSFCRGSSRPRDQTQVSCLSYIGKQILLLLCHLGSPCIYICMYVNSAPGEPPLQSFLVQGASPREAKSH